MSNPPKKHFSIGPSIFARRCAELGSDPWPSGIIEQVLTVMVIPTVLAIGGLIGAMSALLDNGRVVGAIIYVAITLLLCTLSSTSYDFAPVDKETLERARVLSAWKEHTDQLPPEPVEGYSIYVAEKSVDDAGDIHFSNGHYRWENNAWSRVGDGTAASGIDAEQIKAGVSVGEVAARWADYQHRVAAVNEQICAVHQAEHNRRRQQEREAAQLEQRRLDALNASRQLLSMLPGVDAPVAAVAAKETVK